MEAPKLKPPFWLWLNLLSLDAPVVALVWQDFVSRALHAPLFPPGRWVLGFTVWAIYLADRLLDTRKPPAGAEFARHRFYRSHRGTALIALASLLAIDLLIVVLRLRPIVFRNGLFVAFASLAYLFVATTIGERHPRLKTFSVAILFTAGVFLVAWTGAPVSRQALLWPAISFTLLLELNLALIENLERSKPTRPLIAAAIFLGMICFAGGPVRWCAAIALSCAAHVALANRGPKLSCDARRVLADVALLTPLFLLV